MTDDFNKNGFNKGRGCSCNNYGRYGRKKSAAKKRVLFICVHNSARSQMAEAFLNNYGGAFFKAESAGLEPGSLNPVVVDGIKKIGIDISNNKTKSVRKFLKQGKKYDYVITVCDEASAERCPLFPGPGKKLHWGFDDPSALSGSYDEKLKGTIEIRDLIKKKVMNFIRSKGEDNE